MFDAILDLALIIRGLPLLAPAIALFMVFFHIKTAAVVSAVALVFMAVLACYKAVLQGSNQYTVSLGAYCLALLFLRSNSAAFHIPLISGFLAGICALSRELFVVQGATVKASGSTSANPLDSKDSRLFLAEKSSKSFDTLSGMVDLKKKLKEAAQIALSKGPDRQNGVLLIGEPGNGKTEMANALAGELKLPIISVSIPDLASRWVNQTTEMINKLFTDAVAQAPCVLFIDEVDSLLKNRAGRQQSLPEESNMTNAFLTWTVKLRQSRVVLVAATNHIDQLDPAAIREGRFDFKIEVPHPDLEARKAIIKKSLQGQAVQDSVIAQVASRWEGYSAARIVTISKEVSKLMSAGAIAEINFDAFSKALRSVQGLALTTPEDTLGLDDLYLDEYTRKKLTGLAKRLTDVEEILAMGGTVPSGILFSGPPGTGKTTVAKAFAKLAQMPMYPLNVNELMADQTLLAKIYKKAKANSPAIIFIDEADDLLGDRTMSPFKPLTNELLQLVDGSGGKAVGITWIAATNFPDSLDPAALRGGRFTEKVAFHLPDPSIVATFITDWISKAAMPPLSASDLQEWVELLGGLALANVGQILQVAVNNSIVSGENPKLLGIKFQHLLEAKNSVV